MFLKLLTMKHTVKHLMPYEQNKIIIKIEIQ